MAESGSIRAGKAYVELGVLDKALIQGLDRAAARLKAFGAGVREIGTKMMGLGAAVLAPILATTKVFSEMGDQMTKASERTGISVERLSELKYAAKQSGIEFEALEGGIKKMQKAIVEAGQNGSTAFDALGLSVAKLATLSPDEQFSAIAEAISKVSDPTQKAALSMEVFGKSGTELIPLMKNGSAGIDELVARCRKLGLTMSTEDALAATAFGDAMSDVWDVVRQLGFEIGATLAKSLQQFMEGIIKVVNNVRDWMKEHKSLILIVAGTAAGILALGAAITVAGIVIGALGTIVGAVASVLLTLFTAVTTIASVLTTVLFSGIGIVIAGLIGLGGYFLATSGIGTKAIQWLSDKFGGLLGTFKEVLGGIGDAIATGDLKLAFKILWDGIQVVWATGVAAVTEIWQGLWAGVKTIGIGAWDGLLSAIDFVWHAMKVSWIEGVAFLKSAWTEFLSWHAKATQTASDAMIEGWITAEEAFGVITEKEAGERRQQAAAQSGASARAIEDEKKGKLDAINGNRQSDRDAETKRHDKRLADIGEAFGGTKDVIMADKLAAIAKAQAELEKAKGALHQDTGKAAVQREWDTINKIAEMNLKGKGKAAVDGTMAAILSSSRGTFNARSAQGLQGGDRIARAAEATQKNTSAMKTGIDKLKDSVAAIKFTFI